MSKPPMVGCNHWACQPGPGAQPPFRCSLNQDDAPPQPAPSDICHACGYQSSGLMHETACGHSADEPACSKCFDERHPELMVQPAPINWEGAAIVNANSAGKAWDMVAMLEQHAETMHGCKGIKTCGQQDSGLTTEEVFAQVQPAPGGFEEALKPVQDRYCESIKCVPPMPHSHGRIDDLRAAHAKEVEEAKRYGQCTAKDCTRRGMFCGRHHLEIRDNLMAQAHAAGKREMAREAIEHADTLTGPTGGWLCSPKKYTKWLASRAAEEKPRG